MRYINNPDLIEISVSNSKNEYTVVIWCITYNHANFIEQALDGFLKQRTTFDYKIVIFDDASGDGTSDIIRYYQKRYPEKIRAYFAKKNTYKSSYRGEMIQEIIDSEFDVEFVATCEGDDYWVDEYKLQKQYDFMRKHPTCSMAIHASKWLDCRTGIISEFHPYKSSGFLSEREIILREGGNPSTASTFMKSSVHFFPKGFPSCEVVDVKRQLHAMLIGDIYYSDEIMCVYRYMHKGAWSYEVVGNFDTYIEHKLRMIDFYLKFDQYTESRYRSLIVEIIHIYMYEIVEYEIPYINFADEIHRRRAVMKDIDGIYSEILRVGNLVKNELAELDILSKNKLSKFKRVVIFGTGKYSKYAERIITNSGINYVGYIVSNNNEAGKLKNNKAIWNIKEYLFSKDETIVVIGVNQRIEREVLDVLSTYGFDNCVSPFWFEQGIIPLYS